MNPLGAVALALARLVARRVPRRRRSADERARLARASALVDAELAGNLELVTMYLQTKQPAVLEIATHERVRAELATADPALGARLDVLYERIPEAESAMERRGPAGSIRAEDRATVQRWEGYARQLQVALRALPASDPPSTGDRLVEWVRARVEGRAAEP